MVIVDFNCDCHNFHVTARIAPFSFHDNPLSGFVFEICFLANVATWTFLIFLDFVGVCVVKDHVKLVDSSFFPMSVMLLHEFVCIYLIVLKFFDYKYKISLCISEY